MKKWVEKLVDQLRGSEGDASVPSMPVSEDRATLLYVIDTYSKHLLEIGDQHPVRKVRETMDEFAKELVQPKEGQLERVLFRFRQFFAAYRIDEYAYFQKTFEDFRTIIWDFVDQLSEDLGEETKEDSEIRKSLDELKDAVESNSIQVLKAESRKFIDSYMESQFKRDKRRTGRMRSIRNNLNLVKKQLVEANDKMRADHLTKALNRKSFDEYCQQYTKLADSTGQELSMVLLDIDHFKSINDTHGHDVGDFVLKDLVKTLKLIFNRDVDVVARIGGEEFAILLPEMPIAAAIQKAEELQAHVNKEVIVHEKKEIRFTVSMGLSLFSPPETIESWTKRADLALYHSKNTGRNRYTVAPTPLPKSA